MHTGRHARKSHMSDQCDERSRAGELSNKIHYESVGVPSSATQQNRENEPAYSKPYLELGMHTVAATV